VARRQSLDRHGRSRRDAEGLLERARPLRAIDELLNAAEQGDGRALLIEGHPGLGKTCLQEAAMEKARARDFRVLHASGAELERNLALGVTVQLLTRLLSDLPGPVREEMLREAPAPVRVLAGAPGFPPPSEPAAEVSVSHAVFTMLASSAESAVTLVAVDDLHWCDEASLAFVLYLLHRLDELPIAIVLAHRPTTGSGASEIRDRIAMHSAVTLEKLAPLGPDAVAEMTRRELSADADDALVNACVTATAGNPFYLHELLAALKEDPSLNSEQLAERALGLAPDAVIRSLRVRVGRLGEQVAALARAVAILGDDVPVRQAAALSGLRLPDAAAAADRLADAEVLFPREPLQYVHPLVRRAIERDVPASERASRHLGAARLLYAEGESAERVAAHLMVGRGESSGWVVGRLLAAAREAHIRGAARSAINYLERALAEPPSEKLRSEVLAELGAAEAMVGVPEAAEHLVAALEGVKDPLRRARLRLEQGHALYGGGLHAEAAVAYEAGLAELDGARSGPDGAAENAEAAMLHDSLQTGYVATASLTPSLRASAVRRSRELLERAESGPRSAGQRMLLAQAALHSVFAGEPTDRVASLAERAWDGGALLEHDTADGMAWRLATGALTLCGELERSIELIDAALEDARRRSSPLAFATASYCRGLPTLWQGRVADAMADIAHALDATRYGWSKFSRAARATYVLCLLERGDLTRAETVIAEAGPLNDSRDLEDTFCLYARAELRLAQGRAPEALRDACAVDAAIGSEIKVVGYCQWRTVAALAALALNDGEQATALAGKALALADQTGVPHERIRALRVLGLCEGGRSGLRHLEAAAGLGSADKPRLESLRALVDLGAALRRSNHRAAAREPLQRAADLARAGGATVLHEQARTELAAAGARPRRDWLLSGPDSLTPSERRIVELAAAGESNRRIAQMLFVTPKTVEYHLRNSYRKLDVSGRRDLAQALES
jgi:DNA-binding CsgD family transcriptional regulator